MSEHEFFTFSEYMRKEQELLSPSAQDYMEMIYRLSKDNGFTRVNDLASALNVQPPSVTKMIQKLADLKLIKYEKYGVIMLETKGIEIGRVLLNRHNLIQRFLKFLNVKEGLLEETEKIEHTINEEVLSGIKDVVDFFKDYPDLLERFNQYRVKKTMIKWYGTYLSTVPYHLFYPMPRDLNIIVVRLWRQLGQQ